MPNAKPGKKPAQLGSKKEPNSVPTLADQGISKKESMTWQQLADMPAPVFEKKLIAVKAQGEKLTMCSRCRGLLMAERLETLEGRLFMMRCAICGARFEPLIAQHRLHRPEPRRQIPEKPNRARR
jgi:hypothetical protein